MTDLNPEKFFGRSLDTIYGNAEITYGLYTKFGEKTDKPWGCPICGKSYKSKTYAEKHLAKRNCYTARDIFEGTELEVQMSRVKSIIGYTLKDEKPGEYAPWKGEYNNTVKLTAFMLLNLPQWNFQGYIRYIARKKMKNVSPNDSLVKKTNYLCKCGIQESTLQDFQNYMLEHQDMIDIPHTNTQVFRYLKDFETEDNESLWELIRLLEKGSISLQYAIDHLGLLDRIDYMNEAQKKRLDSICTFIELSNN